MKNFAGTKFVRFKNRESRFIDVIDKREKNGDNKENTDDSFRNYSISKEGDRVWSF